MRVSQLIEILQRDIIENGDRPVYYLSGFSAYEVKYLGAAISEFGEYFWLTADSRLMCEVGENPEDYRAPSYKAAFRVVK